MPPPTQVEALTVSLSANPTTGRVLITLTPPESPAGAGVGAGSAGTQGKRAPLDICCVVDVSGSMGVNADVPQLGVHPEMTGLNVLDIVKHSLKTVISTMQQGALISCTLRLGLTEC
jgi:hypothetical protein